MRDDSGTTRPGPDPDAPTTLEGGERLPRLLEIHEVRAAKRQRQRKWWMLLYVALAVVAIDQGSKQWAHTTLRTEHGGRLKVVRGLFSLTYVRNPGAAWGFLSRRPASFRKPFFLAVSVIAIAFILYLFVRLTVGQQLLMIALSLVMGGALGNFIDRLRFNYVIDFLDVYFGRIFKWPTFNVADVAISVGVLMLFYEMISSTMAEWRERRDQRAAAAATATAAAAAAAAAAPPEAQLPDEASDTQPPPGAAPSSEEKFQRGSRREEYQTDSTTDVAE